MLARTKRTFCFSKMYLDWYLEFHAFHNEFSTKSSGSDVTFYQNLAIESKVYSSLYPSCHNQIRNVIFNFKIPYPPPYKREIWHYEQAYVHHIRKAVDIFPWEKEVRSFNINDMVFLFNKTVMKIISYYIPYWYIIIFLNYIDDRDPP